MTHNPFDYHMPDEIKKQLSGSFLASFGEECAKIFELDNAAERNIEGTPFLFQVTGTGGWLQALRATCRRFDMQWLLDYWIRLDRYESDIFDDELASEVVRQFEKEGNAWSTQ